MILIPLTVITLDGKNGHVDAGRTVAVCRKCSTTDKCDGCGNSISKTSRFDLLDDTKRTNFVKCEACGSAVHVNKILKRAKPGEIEQPTNVGLVINMTTAKALGLIIPPSLLLRAGQVIE